MASLADLLVDAMPKVEFSPSCLIPEATHVLTNQVCNVVLHSNADAFCGLQNFISPMILSAPTLPLSSTPDGLQLPAYQSPQTWVTPFVIVRLVVPLTCCLSDKKHATWSSASTRSSMLK